VLLLVVLTTLQRAPAAGAEQASAAAPRQVVVLFVDDSTWSTIPPPPADWARALLSMHSVTNGHRMVDTFLSIGKGGRSGADRDLIGVGGIRFSGTRLDLLDWDALQAHDRRLRFGGRLGAFGESLSRSRISNALVLSDFSIAPVLADERGHVPDAVLGGALELDLARRSGTTLVVGETDSSGLPFMLQGAVGPGVCTIVASASTPAGPAHLGVFEAAPSCGLGSGRLRSPTTRKPDYLVLGDLAPTLLHVLGIDTGEPFEGGVVTPVGGLRSIGWLRDADRHASISQRTERPFIAVMLAAALLCLWGLVTGSRLRRWVAVAALALPVCTVLVNVVPWWRGGTGLGIAMAVGLSGVIAGTALLLFGHRSPRLVLAIATLTAGVIGLDAATGGTLQLNSPLANDAIGAGRFTGIGNVPFGFFGGATIVVGMLALCRWQARAVAPVAAFAALAVVVDGAPVFGADVGGALSLAPALAVLLLCWRRPPALRRLLPLSGLGVAMVAAFAAFDLRRPPGARTHLGRTLTNGTILPTMIRRESGALRSFHSSPYVWVALVGAIGLWLLRSYITSSALTRSGFLALAALGVVGTLVNDSGVAVAAAVTAVAWPAGLLLDGDGRTGAAADPVTPPPGGGRPSGPGAPGSPATGRRRTRRESPLPDRA
jgi:hypothetical protein